MAYYHDMGLGKTFTGGEKLKQLNARVNLVICQKSKINDWVEHFEKYYKTDFLIFDLTNKTDFQMFLHDESESPFERIGVINYDLVFRRPELLNLKDFTLLLDESSLIQNESSKRTKFILRMNPKNVILLSGTPTGGKYEQLWSQLHLLGWNISKKLYWKQYINTKTIECDGFPVKVVTGYKNVERLKKKLREYGADFLKTDEVFDLPEQVINNIYVPTTKEYRKFVKNSVVEFNDIQLIGTSALTKILYERQLCGQYNAAKLRAFKELVESTNDRLVVFYNFSDELEAMKNLIENRSIAVVNGQHKELDVFDTNDDCILFVQYQAGAMGLNLQKANKIIYFTLPLGKGSSQLWEQSKKRIHRIGQTQTCFYYYLLCKNSIEIENLEMLKLGKELTDDLFRERRS